MKPRRAHAALLRARHALSVGLLTAAAAAEPAVDPFALCSTCHGARGVSTLAETPSLAGKHSFYAIMQLFLFLQRWRANEAMTAIAKGMSDADLRAYSELIGKLPPAPDASAAPADAARMARGAALAERHRCASCQGSDCAGEKQTQRLASQREDYLARTLAEFKAGTRLGYTQAMNEVLAGVDPNDLADLAHFLAHADVVRAGAC